MAVCRFSLAKRWLSPVGKYLCEYDDPQGITNTYLLAWQRKQYTGIFAGMGTPGRKSGGNGAQALMSVDAPASAICNVFASLSLLDCFI